MNDSQLVREWQKERGHAPSTKHTNLNAYRRFLARTGLSEADLIQAAKDSKRIRRIADSFIDSEKKAGRRPAYALTMWFAAKSFLDSAGVPVAYNPSLTPEEQEPKDVASRRVPTQVELRRLVDILSLRNRAIVLTLASSGMRVGVLGNGNEGGGNSDGLRLESLPDLDIRTGEFRVKPPLIVVPARLSKSGRAYTTSMSTEAAGVVETMLAQRIASGERLEARSPLFVPDARGADREARTAEGFRTLNRNYLCNMISEAFAKVAPPGIHWTAHTLRAWCSSRLESAESQGLISRTRREWFLGHALGSIDVRYNLTRPLSAEATEELRASYAKVESFVNIVVPREEILRPLLSAVQEALGEKSDPSRSMSAEEIREVLTRLLGTARSTHLGRPGDAIPPASRANEQRAVEAELVGRYLELGWEFKSPLNGHLAVVAWPGH
jgi:integrase